MEVVTCGKFDDSINLSKYSLRDNKKVRVYAKNPNTKKIANYIPISTDGAVVVIDDVHVPVLVFLESVSKRPENKYIVLTWREHSTLMKRSVALFVRLDLAVLEGKYPIFSGIKYSINPQVGYEILNRYLREVKNIGIKQGSLSQHFSSRNHYKVARHIRHKSDLDGAFGFSYMPGYQDVFRFYEERENRAIVLLDFNSMYADCLAGWFVDPGSLQFLSGENITDELFRVCDGIYHVRLKKCHDEFIRKHNSFKYTKLNNSFSFNIDRDQVVEALLHRDEVMFYKEHFEEVDIVAGIVSDKSVRHPLYRDAERAYAKRIKARSVDCAHMERYYKYKLAMLHSASNPLRFRNKQHSSVAGIERYLESEYMVSRDEGVSQSSFLNSLLRRHQFGLSRVDEGYSLRSIDFDNPESVLSISSQVMSKARVKIMRVLERFYKQQDVELCYCNIDSVHLSVKKDQLDAFLKENADLISEKMGDMRVQVIGSRGYWFDVGRYWIYNDDELLQYKNAYFKHSGSVEPFIKIREKMSRFSSQKFDYLVTHHVNIGRAFSNKRKLSESGDGVSDYRRYNIDEIRSTQLMAEAVSREDAKNRIVKIGLFERLKNEGGRVSHST